MMAGEAFYIPGDRAPVRDLVAETAHGRVDLRVGPAVEAPVGTAALILGPGVNPESTLSRVTALRFVQLATCDNPYVDASELDKRSVHVSTISPAAADEVAAHTIGLAIAALRLPDTSGDHSREEIAPFADETDAVSGKQVGIIGLGTVGCAVARRLARSGAKLVYADIRTAPRRSTAGLGIRRSSLDLLLTQSDVIVVTARWGPTANPLLGSRDLRLPDPGSVVVNASDNRLVDESALQAGPSTGQIKGAAFGVPVGNKLTGLPNVITSSLEVQAGSSAAAAELIVSNLERFANDEPVAGLVEPIDYPAAGDPAFWSSRLYPHRAG